MAKRSTTMKLVAMGLIVALQVAFALPVAASDTPAAALSGTVLSASDQAPIAGATIHLGDPETGRIVSSLPTGADGRFAVDAVAPATYEVAVESEGGLYLVASTLDLAPGQTRAADISINGQAAPDPASAQQASSHSKTSVWNNPLTASLIVLGSAFVIGILVDNAIDDDDEPAASPTVP